jgi:hypothetical protein
MQDTAHAAGLRRPTETAPLEVPSSRLRLARGRTPPRAGSAPFEEQRFPRSGPAPLEGSLPLERVSSRSKVRPALGWGPPRSRAPRTRAPAPVHGHLTP